MKVTVVDYGIGNLLSVRRAFAYCGADVSIATTAEEVKQADRLVVPGVGAFSQCMSALEKHELKHSLIDYASTGRPYLGICVGMQMLLDKSFEFGECKGLGVIPGDVSKIEIPDVRVPFMGWKNVDLLEKVRSFYFVHSFMATVYKPEHLWASYTLGDRSITAAIRKDNVLGVQFHPEKSAEDGLEFIRYFLQI